MTWSHKGFGVNGARTQVVEPAQVLGKREPGLYRGRRPTGFWPKKAF